MSAARPEAVKVCEKAVQWSAKSEQSQLRRGSGILCALHKWHMREPLAELHLRTLLREEHPHTPSFLKEELSLLWAICNIVEHTWRVQL